MYLEDSKDFWDWEVEGSKKSIQDDFRIMSFVPPPIRISHLIKIENFIWSGIRKLIMEILICMLMIKTMVKRKYFNFKGL